MRREEGILYLLYLRVLFYVCKLNLAGENGWYLLVYKYIYVYVFIFELLIWGGSGSMLFVGVSK